ncbi:MAG TPA: hypothetical protein VHB21_22910, partial [Minicystis sp.]|nr:hypothetical protein [Minicystis sp.]
YALEYPADAAAIAAQHAALQATLAAMRTLAEVGAFDAGALRKLRLRLHLHHAHEESGLYRWLARNRAGALRTP